MIAWVEGVMREKAPTCIVVDVHGVGYELLIPLSTFEQLPDVGKTVSLYVYTQVAENVLQLFGFASSREKQVFELLLRANRVGPKLAQSILSGLAPERLLQALREGDVRVLRGVPGVGPKMAERMAVELREHAHHLGDGGGAEGGGAGAATGAGGAAPHRDEALSALLNLGYARAQAERAILEAQDELEEDASVEKLLRVVLRGLAR